jgi:hypothetical protein
MPKASATASRSTACYFCHEKAPCNQALAIWAGTTLLTALQRFVAVEIMSDYSWEHSGSPSTNPQQLSPSLFTSSMLNASA